MAAARTARSLLGAEHQVTLIDRNRRTYLCGGFPLLIVGEREAAKLSRSLGFLANRGVSFVQAEVRRIDTRAQEVVTDSGEFGYDYLVIATGAEYDWSAVPGSSEAYSFYSIDTARRLRRKLAGFRRGRIVIAVSSLPYKCPPAPFEAAMVLHWHFKRLGIRKDVEIEVSTPEPRPLKVAGPAATEKLKSDLMHRGIHLRTDAAVKEVSRSGREVLFSDGRTTMADIAITIPAHRPAPVVVEAGLVSEHGWVAVDPATLETEVPNVFAIGDVNMVPMATGMGIPKAGVFASSEGETVGRNIAAAITGWDRTSFPGEGACYLATSGQTAGMLKGRFLASGQPDVIYTSATARGMRGKERFERDWRRFRV